MVCTTPKTHDRERYERLMELDDALLRRSTRSAASSVRERLSKELGHVTPKVGADAAIFNAAGEILLGEPTIIVGACPAAGSSPTRARSRQRCARLARRQVSR